MVEKEVVEVEKIVEKEKVVEKVVVQEKIVNVLNAEGEALTEYNAALVNQRAQLGEQLEGQKAATQAAMQPEGSAQGATEKQQTPTKNGLRTGAEGLRPGVAGFRSAVTAVAEATVGEPAAAARAGAAAAAQAQKEERARIMAEKREAAASALTPTA